MRVGSYVSIKGKYRLVTQPTLPRCPSNEKLGNYFSCSTFFLPDATYSHSHHADLTNIEPYNHRITHISVQLQYSLQQRRLQADNWCFEKVVGRKQCTRHLLFSAIFYNRKMVQTLSLVDSLAVAIGKERSGVCDYEQTSQSRFVNRVSLYSPLF